MFTAAENRFCNNCPEHKTCNYIKMGRTDLCSKLDYFAIGYEQAMADLKEKIAQAKKSGSWNGNDVDEYMKMVRGEE